MCHRRRQFLSPWNPTTDFLICSVNGGPKRRNSATSKGSKRSKYFREVKTSILCVSSNVWPSFIPCCFMVAILECDKFYTKWRYITTETKWQLPAWDVISPRSLKWPFLFDSVVISHSCIGKFLHKNSQGTPSAGPVPYKRRQLPYNFHVRRLADLSHPRPATRWYAPRTVRFPSLLNAYHPFPRLGLQTEYGGWKAAHVSLLEFLWFRSMSWVPGSRFDGYLSRGRGVVSSDGSSLHFGSCFTYP